jgi:hypothetical protein
VDATTVASVDSGVESVRWTKGIGPLLATMSNLCPEFAPRETDRHAFAILGDRGDGGCIECNQAGNHGESSLGVT